MSHSTQGDWDAFFDLLHDDVELREEFIALDIAVYRGHDGVREWLRRSTEVMSGFASSRCASCDSRTRS